MTIHAGQPAFRWVPNLFRATDGTIICRTKP